MLHPAVQPEEIVMGEQQRLFERLPVSWVERLWTRIDPDRRREVVSLLAEMAWRSSIGRGARRAEEPGDES